VLILGGIQTQGYAERADSGPWRLRQYYGKASPPPAVGRPHPATDTRLIAKGPRFFGGRIKYSIECLLLAQSRHYEGVPSMSAFGGKADIEDPFH